MTLIRKIAKSLIIIFSLSLLTLSPVLPQGYLHRNGKYLYDAAGNEIILRGIGTGNWMLQEGYMMQTSDVAGTQHKFRELLVNSIGEEKTDSFYTVWLDSHFRRADVDSMKSWGFNSVRVAMHYKWFTLPIEDEPVPGENTWLEKGFVMIDSLLDWCGDQQMYLILDLHGAPGGQGKDANISDYDPDKPSLWESQANKDKTIALWRKLAERYSTEPWIGGYDLINETNWTFPEGNNSKLKALMVSITNAIREVDQNHLIIIEGNWFANDFSGLTPPWDNNMAYSFHKYWSETTQQSIEFATSLRNTHNVPVWLGESGENSNPWFTSCIALCEKNRIGWSWWPVKKPGINNPLKVTVNEDYTRLVNSWKGSASKPSVDEAFQAVLTFALNHRIENCSFQRDVVDAMIRQPHTSETIPFKLYSEEDVIFATDYNLGRNNHAYSDRDTANIGGDNTVWNRGYSYRNDGVDIETCTDVLKTNGYNVGWTEDGEWMEYTIVSDTTAAFTLQVRSASGGSGSKIHLEKDNIPVTPIINLPGTGGWQAWQTTEAGKVVLSKGINKLRFVFDKGGSNLSYFSFSDPVPAEELAFTMLYARTSMDGYEVELALNKPVVSDPGAINLLNFNISIDELPVSLTNIKIEGEQNQVIKLELSEPLYYGGNIKVSYSGEDVLTDNFQVLEAFENITVANLLPVRYSIYGRIQAENYSFNNGMQAEECSDTGGGLDMGHANAGDYLDYRVYIPETRYYKLNFRVASERSNNQLIIRAGEPGSFMNIDTLVIPSTGDWQSWTTVSVTGLLNEGRYTIRLYVKQGEFNINWFQGVGASGVGIHDEFEDDYQIYPNPSKNCIWVDLTGINNSGKKITICNFLGQPLKHENVNDPAIVKVNLEGFEKGIYFLIIETEDRIKRISRFIKI